jgi:transposase-like protein
MPVWLYYRFPLSLRMVEDLLAAHGIIVFHIPRHEIASSPHRELRAAAMDLLATIARV